jgi:hypothetical protein
LVKVLLVPRIILVDGKIPTSQYGLPYQCPPGIH